MRRKIETVKQEIPINQLLKPNEGRIVSKEML